MNIIFKFLLFSSVGLSTLFSSETYVLILSDSQSGREIHGPIIRAWDLPFKINWTDVSFKLSKDNERPGNYILEGELSDRYKYEKDSVVFNFNASSPLLSWVNSIEKKSVSIRAKESNSFQDLVFEGRNFKLVLALLENSDADSLRARGFLINKLKLTNN